MSEMLLIQILIFLIIGFIVLKKNIKTGRGKFNINTLTQPIIIGIGISMLLFQFDIFSEKNKFSEKNDSAFRKTNNIPPIESNMFVYNSGPYFIEFLANTDSAIHWSKEIKYDFFTKSAEIDLFRIGSGYLAIETTFPSLFRNFKQNYYLTDKDIPITKFKADSILRSKGINLFDSDN